ncbi:unnamed protein product [Rotaria socialis]|uniref:NAD(P)(+)--arginine ADP-ribosyltransferase n=1 Tax=Rotaria socialis TaxID=392032 RepID=A0A817TYD2_9BILA|nr:unnamed protein product [Rotaria socialis]CAF3384730.1 unnamed protein product [Rotaria socialis]CAF4127245.1 unnamed protein product [Rotaria socialis]CAF4499555.1 unnamed protein product [Rotaria socialis]
MSRSVNEIITDLTSFNPRTATAQHRLSHDCYMILVGYVDDKKQLAKLKHMIESLGETTTDEYGAAASLAVMECENVEFIIEHIVLRYNSEELLDARNEHFVYEDNFNGALTSFIAETASLQKLRKICRYYENRRGINVENVIAEHDARAASSSKHFLEKGLSKDEALAAAFAISFYTGSKSEACSRGASLIARQSNGVVIDDKTVQELSEASIILYYLVKALSQIPYYWGYVTRACQLKDAELEMYAAGALITWIQFSSSKKGKKAANNGDFSNRNTFFKIYSLTGRPIQQFSNYPEEDEVLFLPHSTFLVFKHSVSHHGTQHTIYMRQVELGLSAWSVLWVDDNIFNAKWENKAHMEFAAAKELNKNVHFIPKSSTENALSFLRSPFGQILKNRDKFRIVTDMHRDNEQSPHNAGSRLIKGLRQLGFRQACFVFTMQKDRCDQILKDELNTRERQNVTVSINTLDLREFVNFQ